MHFASRQAHHKSEAIGDDREVRLPHAGSTGTQHERPRHEQFEPNLDIKGRQGPYGKGKGGQERQKGSEGKGKSSGKGKGKQGKSPPGGVTYYNDFIGKSGWDHGYCHTWYWNERRGRFWRWD